MWSSFTLTSADPPALLAERLRAEVNAPDGFFRGTVGDAVFCITRRIGSLERTWPIDVQGRCESAPEGGSIIHTRTGPRWLTLVLVVAASVYLVGMALSPIGGAAEWFAPYFFAGMIAFLWFTMWIATVFEERQAQGALIRILRAKGPPSLRRK